MMPDDRQRLPVLQPGATDASPPIFEKIAVVGLGLIGGSIALAARRIWPSGLVIGVDDKAVLERAMVRHAIDVAADDLVVAAEADLIILAAPTRDNITLLGTLGEEVKGPAVVTDVSSTKRAIVEAAAALPDRFTFIGGHPLGGAPRGGFEYARPDLFRNRPWIFTPPADAGSPVLDQLQSFATALGAVPHVMTPGEHDRLLAYLSHLPQLAASALMHVVGDAAREDGLALTGRGLADTTRLASSPAAIWRDICSTNRDEIEVALDVFIESLVALRHDLADGHEVDRVFRSAAGWRAVLSRRTTRPDDPPTDPSA